MSIYIVSNSLGLRLRRNDRDTRLQQAQKFRAMYRNLGLDLSGCAKLLHVTERTLHNWESGKHDIPYATFKLLRLLNGMDLPGESWRGWCFQGGKLWSPEGRSFVGSDGSWWSLLVRQAAMFGQLMNGVRQALRSPGRDAPAARPGREAPGLVSVSTTCKSGDISRFDITSDSKLTSDLTAPMISASYQFDHRLTSCPTPYGSRPTLKQQPASGPQPSASASMPSFASVSMPTSTAQANPPARPLHPGPQPKASNGVQGVMKPSFRPLQSKPSTTTGNRLKMTGHGSSSIQTPKCGLGMTRPQHGTAAEMKSSAKTGLTPALSKSSATRASLRTSIGQQGSDRPTRS